MKLVALTIYKWDETRPVELTSHYNLSSFSFFEKGTVKEHIRFHSRLICSRTSLGSRQSIEFEQNLGCCHIYVHPSGVASTVLASPDYPMRVAFSLLNEVIRAFVEKHGEAKIKAVAEDTTSLAFPEGEDFLQKFQAPEEADKLSKVQKDLDEVKGVMLKSIDDLLQRGETLDSLMQKSTDLSNSSYQFYRTAKRNNQCCQLY